jgi:hypothetical protein
MKTTKRHLARTIEDLCHDEELGCEDTDRAEQIKIVYLDLIDDGFCQLGGRDKAIEDELVNEVIYSAQENWWYVQACEDHPCPGTKGDHKRSASQARKKALELALKLNAMG